MSEAPEKRGLADISGVKESRDSEAELKRPKVVEFCQFGCGHLADANNKDDNGPVCCRSCPMAPAKAARATTAAVPPGKQHTQDCQERWIAYKNRISSVKTWADVNKQLGYTYKKQIKAVMDKLLASILGVQSITDLIVEYASPWIDTRFYWTPVAGKPEQEDRQVTVHDSKFAGYPQLLSSDDWPQCKKCETLLPLYFQINVNQLPAEYRDMVLPHREKLKNHLIQFFCCTACDDCFDAYSEGQVVRVVPIVENQALLQPKSFLDEMMGFLIDNHQVGAEELFISSWQKSTEPEGPQIEHEDETITDVSPLEFTSECLGECFEEFEDSLSQSHLPLTSDKLYGWPAWINKHQYPKCSKCNESMVYIFQYNAQNIGESFGIQGTGWLFICQYHYDVVAFQTQSIDFE